MNIFWHQTCPQISAPVQMTPTDLISTLFMDVPYPKSRTALWCTKDWRHYVCLLLVCVYGAYVHHSHWLYGHSFRSLSVLSFFHVRDASQVWVEWLKLNLPISSARIILTLLGVNGAAMLGVTESGKQTLTVPDFYIHDWPCGGECLSVEDADACLEVSWGFVLPEHGNATQVVLWSKCVLFVYFVYAGSQSVCLCPFRRHSWRMNANPKKVLRFPRSQLDDLSTIAQRRLVQHWDRGGGRRWDDRQTRGITVVWD